MAERRFGMPVSEWAQARRELEELLAEAAARRSTVTYGEAARRAFGGRFSARSRALMALLSEVDSATHDALGVMVAALVVRADTGRPGEGFFNFAEQAAATHIEDREAYWRDQAERVWNAFATDGRS